MMTRRWLPIVSFLLAMPLWACGPSQAHLVVKQTTDIAPDSEHKSHLAPGGSVNITVAISNLGPGSARGVGVTELLPRGFRYQSLTTLGGNAIRTVVEEPAPPGDPHWGVWTIPPRTSTRESALVLSFKVQAATQSGEFRSRVKITTTTSGDVEEGDPLVLVVEPRPALTLAAAATSAQVLTGGTVTYVLSVTNTGSAAAKAVTVSVSLPAGFLYQATSGLEGNSPRVEAVDPPGNSLLPVWSSWEIPGLSGGTPGLLRITFRARILPGSPPGTYGLTAAVSGTYTEQSGSRQVLKDLPTQTVGDTAPVAVAKGTSIPVIMMVSASAQYVPQNGAVVYAITVENDGVEAARNLTITDTLPPGFTYQSTNGLSLNGQNVSTQVVPSPGTAAPQWGPFTIPAGGLGGSTLVITFTARVSATASLGAHPNSVSGSSSNADISGATDVNAVIVTAG